MSKTIKPSGVSHTVMPEKPAKNYNDWVRHITGKNTAKRFRWEGVKP